MLLCSRVIMPSCSWENDRIPTLGAAQATLLFQIMSWKSTEKNEDKWRKIYLKEMCNGVRRNRYSYRYVYMESYLGLPDLEVYTFWEVSEVCDFIRVFREYLQECSLYR